MIVTASLDSSGNKVIQVTLNYTEFPQLQQSMNFMVTKLTRTVQAEVQKTLPPTNAQMTLNFLNQLLLNISTALGTVS